VAGPGAPPRLSAIHPDLELRKKVAALSKENTYKYKRILKLLKSEWYTYTSAPKKVFRFLTKMQEVPVYLPVYIPPGNC
jgi:hypothetical protein